MSETNSLVYRYPYISDEWNVALNTDQVDSVTYGSTTPYHWICRFHDHEYQQSPNRRTDLNTCRYGFIM